MHEYIQCNNMWFHYSFGPKLCHACANSMPMYVDYANNATY